MAGIFANSVSVTMSTTSTDATQAGYLSLEQVSLSATPTGSTYLWSLAKPAGATARSDLNSSTDAAPHFTPDVEGFWLISVTVNSTTSYRLRLSVTSLAQATTREALRLSPKADAAVATPPLGAAVYYSSDRSAFAMKSSAGVVLPVQSGVGGLVPLGGGVPPTLGTIGGSGPATAGQNSWLVFTDNTGASFWVPVWR